MGKLMYVTNVSLDGFIEDEQGDFNWSDPDDEQFAFITELIRPFTTHLYGRRLYESMAVWETDPTFAAGSPLAADFAAVWQGADKVVYSTTLEEPWTARTRLEGHFDPAAVRPLIDASSGDVMIGGAALAGQAFRAGLVDEIHLFVAPIVLGGGKPSLPSDGRASLELLDHRRFPSGITYLRHRIMR